MVSVVPITGDLHQICRATILGDKSNLVLALSLDWNKMAGYWVLGISDPSTNDSILTNVPLLPGYDLLGQYKYLGIGSAYLVNTGDQSILTPDSDNLIDNFSLVWKYSG